MCIKVLNKNLSILAYIYIQAEVLLVKTSKETFKKINKLFHPNITKLKCVFTKLEVLLHCQEHSKTDP